MRFVNRHSYWLIPASLRRRLSSSPEGPTKGCRVTLAPPRIEDDADIQLLWRRGKPDQPVNSGVVYSKPGQVAFWDDYGLISGNLPWRLHGWFCDQLAFSLMTGVYNKAGDILTIGPTRIKLVDALDHCERPGRATEKAWAHHLKGSMKGEEFRQYYKRAPKSGAGRPSVGSASSTVGVEGQNWASQAVVLRSHSATG